MSYVPRRATKHGLFVPGSEVCQPTLKPGQTDVHRRGLYSEEKVDSGESFLVQDLKQQTEYSKEISSAPRVSDYIGGGARASAPQEEEATWRRPGGSRHWRSEYNSALGEAAVSDERAYARHRTFSYGPMPPGISRLEDLSMYRWEFGRCGSNPRDKINPLDLKLPVFKTALNAGTTKASGHVPGYQGHIPCHITGPLSARAAMAETARIADKANVVDTFHSNIVGYSGFEPRSVRSGYVGRRPTSLTVYGRDFISPRVHYASET